MLDDKLILKFCPTYLNRRFLKLASIYYICIKKIPKIYYSGLARVKIGCNIVYFNICGHLPCEC